MRYYNGFIIDAEEFRVPSYTISPFSSASIATNAGLLANRESNQKLIADYFGNYLFCPSGRTALGLALRQYDLQAFDEVWIVTTSGNRYISRCVTQEIEKVCQWSLKHSLKTRVILVNHEFGHVYTDVRGLRSFGLPIIEDLAFSALSLHEVADVGIAGDYAVFSLPKIFPLQFGGILKINTQARRLGSEELLPPTVRDDLTVLLSRYLQEIPHIRASRRQNYSTLLNCFRGLGFGPRFQLRACEVPGVFMFKTEGIDLDGLKRFMQRNGVESSVFYGEEAFFVPLHQNLVRADLLYFFTLVRHFLKHGIE